LVSGNVFYDTAPSGASQNSAIAYGGTGGAVITDNSIYKGVTKWAHAININSATGQVIVKNNVVFDACCTAAVYLALDSATTNVEFIHNKIVTMTTATAAPRYRYRGTNFTVDAFGSGIDSDEVVLSPAQRSILTASAAPTTGTWKVADIVYNSAPTATSQMGWVNTTAGTPGTWTVFGQIGSLSKGIGWNWNNGAAALTTGMTGYMTWEASPCTLTKWGMTVNPSDTVTANVWKVSSGTALPTSSNSIIGTGTKPNIASGSAANATVNWSGSTVVATGDVLGFNIDAVGGTATQASLVVQCQQ
jgi:hypothetical protein